jgi:acetyltransferase-like isoleucine patch superfamily enzyme
VYYPGVWIVPGRGLALGDDVDLALDVLITTSGGVTIGDRSLIGYRTQILSGNHRIPVGKERIFGSGHVVEPVVIGADVWIGANCTILPGVSIGSGAVVAAGSVVTKDVGEYTVVAGVPAREIRCR